MILREMCIVDLLLFATTARQKRSMSMREVQRRVKKILDDAVGNSAVLLEELQVRSN